MLSRAIREGYPPGPERERWLRWLTRIASADFGLAKGAEDRDDRRGCGCPARASVPELAALGLLGLGLAGVGFARGKRNN
jgi:hypothetical protein